MVKISIIMPLYNAGKYLTECLQSVLGQTFTDYELICVNDNSTDDTVRILNEFQKNDNRIKIYSNEQQCGAAYSRNRGMKKAGGVYLVFLDGDDIFDEMMLERAYNTAEEKKADIVMYDYKHVPSDNIHHRVFMPHSEKYMHQYCEKTFSVLDCEPYTITNWSTGPCNKLYRRRFIQQNQLEFQNLPCSNDVYFVCMALMLADKIIVLKDEKVMVYARDHFEPGRISANRDSMCVYKALMKVAEELVRRSKFDKLAACFYYEAIFLLRSGILADKNVQRAKSFYTFLQKEGIQRICTLSEYQYCMADLYTQSVFEKFLNNSFESNWYRDENILKIYLNNKKGMILDLYNRLRCAEKKVAIWGAGENGRVLVSFFLENSLEIEAVIDISKERQGESIGGCRIVLPEEVFDQVQTVIVSARYICGRVREMVGERDIEVIDINQFFGLT